MLFNVFATQLLPGAKHGSTIVKRNEIVESLVSKGSFNVAVKTIVLAGAASASVVV